MEIKKQKSYNVEDLAQSIKLTLRKHAHRLDVCENISQISPIHLRLDTK